MPAEKACIMGVPTLKDVARLAKVSVSTASRALTGNPHVSIETRARVFQAAKMLSYQPDRVAQSLRRRRSDLIGLVVSTIENPFFTEVALGAEKAARLRGYNLIVCNTDEDPQQEADYLGILERLLVAGIIIAPAPGNVGQLERLANMSMPVVLVNRSLDIPDCSSVCADDEVAAFQCVSQLIADGRRRIAAITGLPGVSTTQQRLQGYRRALATLEVKESVCPPFEMSGNATLAGGYEAVCRLMQGNPTPDAMFAFNNLMTQGAVMALHDLGIDRPKQVDVAGFGALPRMHHCQPPPLLIAQPAHQMGEKAVDMLLSQFEAGSTRKSESVVLSNTVLPRQYRYHFQRTGRLGSLYVDDAAGSAPESARASECWDGVRARHE